MLKVAVHAVCCYLAGHCILDKHSDTALTLSLYRIPQGLCLPDVGVKQGS